MLASGGGTVLQPTQPATFEWASSRPTSLAAMNQAPGEAVQKVCPRCSTLAYTGDRHCPWCGGSYKRRLWPALLVLLVVQTVLLAGAAAYGYTVAADEVDDQLDEQVNRVERDLDRSFRDVQRLVREELDRRLPAQP
jgi:RNA polymerase subunit RPABC4/transcription elongation factor Spt4